MNDHDRFVAATRLLDDPLVKDILRDMETDALSALLVANSDEGRRDAAEKIRVIRSFLARLRLIQAEHEENKVTELRVIP